MADQLSDDQISEFKEAFSLFDKDGDGWHGNMERQSRGVAMGVMAPVVQPGMTR